VRARRLLIGLIVALPLSGCGLLDTRATNTTDTTAAANDVPAVTAPVAATPPTPAAPIRTDPDPEYPHTPAALKTAVGTFVRQYVDYIYGRSLRLPDHATGPLRRRIAGNEPVAELRQLTPSITVIYLHFWDDRTVSALAIVEDGTSRPQSIPATFRRSRGQWQATTVAEGDA
jgi:hypothetical protein